MITKHLKPICYMLCVCLLVTTQACKKDGNSKENEDMAVKRTPQTFGNVLLDDYTGPYGGVPAFDKMTVEDVMAAAESGMAMQLEEIDAIANNPEAPTFENTIVEMERAGRALNNFFSYYGIMSSNRSSPEFREVQGQLAPKFSEFQSKISQNEKLFQRIKAVYDDAQENPLDDDQQRVVDLTYKGFAMNGADLDSIKKKRYAAINKELSSLYTNFSNNVLHDEENYVTFVCSNGCSRFYKTV